MKVKKVTDKAFRKYGKVMEGIDFSSMIDVLEDISCGEDVDYVASYQPLEELPLKDMVRDDCFGELAIEIGYCAGHNNKLNALEYHRSSEIDVAAMDMILLLGSQADIDEHYKYNTNQIEAFFVPAGTAVELYATTLHFAPCGLEKNKYAFKTAVVLPYGTNFDKRTCHEPMNKEGELYFAKNKWLLAHKDGGQEGAYVGLTGENICLEGPLKVLEG